MTPTVANVILGLETALAPELRGAVRTERRARIRRAVAAVRVALVAPEAFAAGGRPDAYAMVRAYYAAGGDRDVLVAAVNKVAREGIAA